MNTNIEQATHFLEDLKAFYIIEVNAYSNRASVILARKQTERVRVLLDNIYDRMTEEEKEEMQQILEENNHFIPTHEEVYPYSETRPQQRAYFLRKTIE